MPQIQNSPDVTNEPIAVPGEVLAADLEPRGGNGLDGDQPRATALKGAAGDFVGAVRGFLQARTGEARVKGQEAYGRARELANQRGAQVDRFVRERPYATLGLAVLAGFIVRGMMRRRR